MVKAIPAPRAMASCVYLSLRSFFCVRGLSFIALMLGISLLSGCGGDLKPTGTAAKIASKASTLPRLPVSNKNDAKSVVQRALHNDPVVREEASLTQASAEQISIERAAFLPSLSFGLTGGVGKAGSGDPSAELSGDQLLFDFGGTKRKVSAADINLQIQYLKFQSAIDDAVVNSLQTYGQIKVFEKTVALKSEQVRLMKELYALIATRIDIGASSTPDLLETQNRIERADYDRLNAQLELEELRDKLIRISGQSQGGKIPNFAESCNPPSGMTDDVQIKKLEIIKANLNLVDAQRARLPKLSLNPLALAPLGGGGVVSGVNVDVGSTLFEGGATASRQNAAFNRKQSAIAALDSAERDSRLDEMRLKRQLSSLRQKTKMLQQQIDVSAETRDLYRSQYIELGTRQITDVLDIEETLFSRRQELIETEFELQQRVLECASRAKALREDLNLSQYQIYGYPLSKDGF